MTPFSITGGTASKEVVAVSPGASYAYYVRCKDTVGNLISSANEEEVLFSVNPTGTDTTPPVVKSSFPTGTLPNTVESIGLVVTTDEDAVCRFATTPGQPYSAMTKFENTGTVTSSQTISVAPGVSYTYYVKCADFIGNTMTSDEVVNFSVAN